MGGITSLAYPLWLLALLVVIAIAAGYVYMARRRSKRSLAFANTAVLDSVAPKGRNRLRHVPIALLCVGLVLLTIAIAQPQALRKVPRNRATVVLVIDVSLSMQSKDVAPDRLNAAKEAAIKFADELTPGINLGVVAYAGTSSLLVSPTPDRGLARAAISNLELAEKTATGEGIFTALKAIQNINMVLGGNEHAPPARIVLESDGKETVPLNPDDPRGAFTAARQAQRSGIQISTISFGTSSGTVSINGEVIPVPVDNASLEQIASLSGGRAFTATNLGELNQAYDTLQEEIGFDLQRGDNSRIWLIFAALFVAAGVASGIGLNRRIP